MSWRVLDTDVRTIRSAGDVEAYCREMLSQIARCEVANRPGRVEPRVIKRRRHGYPLMQEPCDVLKAKLLNEDNGKA
ncbi:MAG: hypothetical protein R3C19_25785 [Planctomycetaceae bacterium]